MDLLIGHAPKAWPEYTRPRSVRSAASLRLTRADQGEDLAALSRRDIVAFTNRLAHQQCTGQISDKMRVPSAGSWPTSGPWA